MSRYLCLLMLFLVIGVIPLSAQEEPDPTPAFDPVPVIDTGADDITNILLLGSDTNHLVNAGRTDVMMIVSLNMTANTINLLSIPRDLYVYVPGHGMNKINVAYGYGNMEEEGRGAELIKETIRYNLGVEIDYYARVNFADFKGIIDALGGIEMTVDCPIEDWRLIDPALDPQDEASWELVTLPVGLHRMDGDQALWYVRSRRTSSDFDRGRRQQDMIRAIWRNVRSMGLFEQVTDVWPQALELVTTDMVLTDITRFIPLAMNLETNRLSSFTFTQNVHVKSGYSAGGSYILEQDREAVAALMREFLTPPTASQISGHTASIEVVNASGIRGMATVAADRLLWEGFAVTIAENPADSVQQYTQVMDYTGQTKGGYLPVLKELFRLSDAGITIEAHADRDFDYRVFIGNTYYPCTHPVVPSMRSVAPENEPETDTTEGE